MSTISPSRVCPRTRMTLVAAAGAESTSDSGSTLSPSTVDAWAAAPAGTAGATAGPASAAPSRKLEGVHFQHRRFGVPDQRAREFGLPGWRRCPGRAGLAVHVECLFADADQQIALGRSVRRQQPGMGIDEQFAFVVPNRAVLEHAFVEAFQQQRHDGAENRGEQQQADHDAAREPRDAGRRLVDVADVETVVALAGHEGSPAPAAVPSRAGSAWVPGRFGRGSTSTRPPARRTLKVGIVSVNGGGEQPSSGRYW